eukprot:3965158-Prymnesium_polylepis.1
MSCQVGSDNVRTAVMHLPFCKTRVHPECRSSLVALQCQRSRGVPTSTDRNQHTARLNSCCARVGCA